MFKAKQNSMTDCVYDIPSMAFQIIKLVKAVKFGGCGIILLKTVMQNIKNSL